MTPYAKFGMLMLKALSQDDTVPGAEWAEDMLGEAQHLGILRLRPVEHDDDVDEYATHVWQMLPDKLDNDYHCLQFLQENPFTIIPTKDGFGTPDSRETFVHVRDLIADRIRRTVKRPVVDMKSAKPGQLLLSKHGRLFVYVQHVPDDFYYPHLVRYRDMPGKHMASRTDEGWVFAHKWLPGDEDIVEILPQILPEFV